MAATFNLYIEQGSDFDKSITLEQKVAGVISPIDLTGFTVKAHLRKSFFSLSAVVFIVNITDAVNGKIELKLSHTQTKSLKPGRFFYDVMISSIGDIRDRILEGSAIVTPGVTDFDL